MGLPIINLSLLPVFPASVIGDGPIVVTKAGLVYTFNWDITVYSVNPAPGGDTVTLLGYNATTGTTERYDAAAGRELLGLGNVATLNVGSGLSSVGGNLVVADSGVVAGAYTLANVTVGADGRITSIANGNVADGDKGDITVSSSGTVWTVDQRTITYAKMQAVTTARMMGRLTAGSGDMEELSATQVRDSFLPTGMIVDRTYAETTTYSNISTVIPLDDTIPQNTEGTQLLQVTITPKSTTNRLRVRATVPVSIGTANAAAVVAAFKNGSTDAIATNWRFDAPGYGGIVVVECEYVPGSTSTATISVRVGVSTAASSQTVAVNGIASGRQLGGASRATLVVEEIKA